MKLGRREFYDVRFRRWVVLDPAREPAAAVMVSAALAKRAERIRFGDG